LSSSTAQLLGQNGSVSKGKKRLFFRILICLSKLNGRFRISKLSSSTAQLLGQNGSVSKGKKRLFCRILICLSKLNGRFRISI
jgi:hypothetical protein